MCIDMNTTATQNWIMLVSLLVTMGTTIFLQIKSNNNTQKEFLDKQLQEIQRLSFYDSFVENENYTNSWVLNKELYNRKELNNEDLNNFLKYDVYTEMIFNFLEMSFKFYKTEKKLLNYVDFKSWLRIHAKCWQNPLQEHSNREVYGDKLCDMVDRWLK